jgi:toxin secretion/phage lysis holin
MCRLVRWTGLLVCDTDRQFPLRLASPLYQFAHNLIETGKGGRDAMQQLGFNTLFGIGGAVLNYMFGGWNELTQLLFLLIALDYVTGLAASIKMGKGLNSERGFWGIWRKGLMVLIVMVGHRFDLLLGTEIFMVGFTYFYLANELISITENCGRLGLPLPGIIRKLIEVLKDKGDGRK